MTRILTIHDVADASHDRRVLITGGAGFIGSHLCDRLIEGGAYVICLDNFSTGRRHNVEHLVGHPRFSLIRHDVIDPIAVDVDQIYNLACPASPTAYAADPVHTTKTSVLGALNLLKLATENGARILQASTSEIYGDPQVSPQPEAYWGHVDPTGPRACYDEGKRCAESLFFDYARRFGTRIKIARIFNTYGPRMRGDDGRVTSNLIIEALRGTDMTVYGDGSQTRSFCYVDETVEALIRLMATPDGVEGPVNIGNPDERTIQDFAGVVQRMTGSSSRISHRPLPVDDPRRRCPDISEATRLLGWVPTISLEAGLALTIDYFREELVREPGVREAVA
ncbi:NAD-dependent epimerase/dehydratase [Ancylobacter novellus DSM 506]|uniref:NAD-dependent epimerase/dehydratase n=1 Tax=Ancylobacter novellus (strain ATCC 8093 / DSM 506 / JCM 20403 / CCM 1077 / IAM 12100 / NBRC 12443 / NCIMB 10456) TaxID=639283 RepID=D7A474_ANCN5|nr:UDP-glucuronic acid decarboxylase family protein [Ancylobacter novellus]ADH87894.1 NAD-dependent epimerase/dehydratase [Ancylobacter novellus DSM 506]